MCGIVACISKEECSTILYDGLVQLKNRGYDSVGICTINNKQQFVVNKYASIKNIDIYNKLQEQLYHHEKAMIGIAHTRWATHGAKTDTNSHPHVSMCGKFMLVHNGIIENYKNLKQMLIDEKYVFQSHTDTEVIVQLLSFLYAKHKAINNNITITECIEEMLCMLEGTWGLVILFIDEPETLYCVRHGSPLLVGYDDNIAIVVSEKSGFCNRIKKYIVLNNLDICKIINTNIGIKIDTKVEYFIKNVDNIKYDLSPEPYTHWTLKEIYEQPQAALQAINMGGRIINNDKVKLGGLDKNVEQLKKIDNLILLGCGSSYFSGQYGLHFFKDLCNFNTVQLFDGAEFNDKDIPKHGKTALLLISQSGETKDLHRCIEIGKDQNLLMIGLVNVVDSLIAREVDCGCYLNAGREVAVASTKAFTSQIILLSMIAIWFSQTKNINKLKRETYINDITQLHYNIQSTLQMNDNSVEILVEKIFSKCENCFLLGKCKSEAVAKEGALKIKEITYIHSEGYSTSSLKHGPFALLNQHFPVIIIAPNDRNYSKAENAYEEIKSRNAPIIFITDKIDQDKENVIYVPENKTFRDFLCVIPLQLLAYKIAIQRGINPDVPKNLAKVVTVE
jgi:glucosamine--fructose-6-phosphate aminotransferase (isomerizing)